MFNKSKLISPANDLESRRAILWMHPTALIHLMTSRRWVVLEGNLPEDVQFHHVFLDPSREVFGIVCLSQEFDQVLLGAALPELPQMKFKYWNPEKDGAIE